MMINDVAAWLIGSVKGGRSGEGKGPCGVNRPCATPDSRTLHR